MGSRVTRSVSSTMTLGVNWPVCPEAGGTAGGAASGVCSCAWQGIAARTGNHTAMRTGRTVGDRATGLTGNRRGRIRVEPRRHLPGAGWRAVVVELTGSLPEHWGRTPTNMARAGGSTTQCDCRVSHGNSLLAICRHRAQPPSQLHCDPLRNDVDDVIQTLSAALRSLPPKRTRPDRVQDDCHVDTLLDEGAHGGWDQAEGG